METWRRGRNRTSKCLQPVGSSVSSGYLATLLFCSQIQQTFNVRPHFDGDEGPECDLKEMERKLREHKSFKLTVQRRFESSGQPIVYGGLAEDERIHEDRSYKLATLPANVRHVYGLFPASRRITFPDLALFTGGRIAQAEGNVNDVLVDSASASSDWKQIASAMMSTIVGAETVANVVADPTQEEKRVLRNVLVHAALYAELTGLVDEFEGMVDGDNADIVHTANVPTDRDKRPFAYFLDLLSAHNLPANKQERKPSLRHVGAVFDKLPFLRSSGRQVHVKPRKTEKPWERGAPLPQEWRNKLHYKDAVRVRLEVGLPSFGVEDDFGIEGWETPGDPDYERAARRVFGTVKRVRKAFPRRAGEGDLDYFKRLAAICELERKRRARQTGRYTLVAPRWDFYDGEDRGFDFRQQLLLAREDGGDWRRTQLHLPNQCLAVNANGLRCRNAGRAADPRVDGEAGLHGMFCKFHSAVFNPEQSSLHFIDEYQHRDLADMVTQIESNVAPARIPQILQIDLAPTEPAKGRVASFPSRSNRGLLVTLKNMIANVTHMVGDGNAPAKARYRGKQGKLQWTVDYLDRHGLERFPARVNGVELDVAVGNYTQESLNPKNYPIPPVPSFHSIRGNNDVLPHTRREKLYRLLNERLPELTTAAYIAEAEADAQFVERFIDILRPGAVDQQLLRGGVGLDLDISAAVQEAKDAEVTSENAIDALIAAAAQQQQVVVVPVPAAAVPAAAAQQQQHDPDEINLVVENWKDFYLPPQHLFTGKIPLKRVERRGLFASIFDAIGNVDMAHLVHESAGPGVFALAELGALQKAYNEQSKRTDEKTMMQAYVDLYSRYGGRKADDTPANCRVSVVPGKQVYAASDNDWTRHAVLAAGEGQRWTIVSGGQDVEQLVRHIQERDPHHGVTVQEHLGDLRVINLLSNTRPLIYTPDDELVGSSHDLTNLFFGKVRFGFRSGDFTAQEKRQVLDIIENFIGVGNPYISWCEFELATGASFLEEPGLYGGQPVLELTLRMLSDKNMRKLFPELLYRELEVGFSVTHFTRTQSTTFFNRDNWTHMPHFHEDGRTQDDYRVYLVAHELYHAVSMRHHITEDAYDASKDSGRPLQMLSQMTRRHFFDKRLGTAPVYAKRFNASGTKRTTLTAGHKENTAPEQKHMQRHAIAMDAPLSPGVTGMTEKELDSILGTGSELVPVNLEGDGTKRFSGDPFSLTASPDTAVTSGIEAGLKNEREDDPLLDAALSGDDDAVAAVEATQELASPSSEKEYAKKELELLRMGVNGVKLAGENNNDDDDFFDSEDFDAFSSSGGEELEGGLYNGSSGYTSPVEMRAAGDMDTDELAKNLLESQGRKSPIAGGAAKEEKAHVSEDVYEKTRVSQRSTSSSRPDEYSGDSSDFSGDDSSDYSGDSSDFSGDSSDFSGDSSDFSGDSSDFSGDSSDFSDTESLQGDSSNLTGSFSGGTNDFGSSDFDSSGSEPFCGGGSAKKLMIVRHKEKRPFRVLAHAAKYVRSDDEKSE